MKRGSGLDGRIRESLTTNYWTEKQVCVEKARQFIHDRALRQRFGSASARTWAYYTPLAICITGEEGEKGEWFCGDGKWHPCLQQQLQRRFSVMVLLFEKEKKKSGWTACMYACIYWSVSWSVDGTCSVRLIIIFIIHQKQLEPCESVVLSSSKCWFAVDKQVHRYRYCGHPVPNLSVVSECLLSIHISLIIIIPP